VKNNDLKSFTQLPRPQEQSPKTFKYHEPVIGSEQIKWKPIDVVAARVVAPAPWYCQQPTPEPVFMKPEFPEPAKAKTKMMLTDDGYIEEHIDRAGVDAMAVDQHTRTVKDGIKASEQLVERSRELIATIDYLVQEIRGPWREYQEFVKSSLTEVREQRIALGSETRLLMGALKEVRQFFLDENYEKEINRLHEFIDLCERLKQLKESGFLDTVADTLLKLSP
jgi:hypothetical protein